MHRSILPSYFFQPSLLQLPIPTLQDTLSRYLRSVAPLVSPAALAHTTALVASFGSSDGLRLHAQLLENARRAPHTSYISDDWFEMYLTSRCVRACGALTRAPPPLRRSHTPPPPAPPLPQWLQRAPAPEPQPPAHLAQ